MKFIAGALVALVAADVGPSSGMVSPDRIRVTRILRPPDDFVFPASIHPDRREVVAGRRDGSLAVWTPGGKPAEPAILSAHTGYAAATAFSPDGTMFVSGGWDKKIMVWAASTRLALGTAAMHEEIHSVAFSTDGTKLLAGGESAVHIWDCPDLKIPRSLPEPLPRMIALSVGADRVAAASYDGTVRIWEVSTGKKIADLADFGKPIVSVSVSADGGRVAAGSLDGSVAIWRVAGGKPEIHAKGHTGPVYAVAFAPTGGLVASGSMDGIRLWNPSGKVLKALPGPPAVAIRFVDRGSAIMSTHADGAVRFWSANGPRTADGIAERPAGFLGVSYNKGDSGVTVTDVVADSQAQRIGIQAGDIIQSANGVGVQETDDFLNYMRTTKEGDELFLKIRRDGAEKVLRIRLGRWK